MELPSCSGHCGAAIVERTPVERLAWSADVRSNHSGLHPLVVKLLAFAGVRPVCAQQFNNRHVAFDQMCKQAAGYQPSITIVAAYRSAYMSAYMLELNERKRGGTRCTFTHSSHTELPPTRTRSRTHARTVPFCVAIQRGVTPEVSEALSMSAPLLMSRRAMPACPSCAAA